MKNLAIYVADISNVKIGPKFKEPIYSKAYPQLFSLIYQLGVMPIIVHNQNKTYLGDGVFSEYWTPKFNRNYDLIKYDYYNNEIRVNLVYDKARFIASDVEVINNQVIRSICKNKYLSYILFPDFHPDSMLLTCDEHLEAYLIKFSQKKIVLKELDSNGGKAVYVGNANDYKNNLSYPLLAQRFIETIKGYKDTERGRHDLRIVIFDGYIIQGRLRRPANGDYISNISYGGDNRVLCFEEIPDGVIKRINKIDDRIVKMFGQQHRLYSADFGYNGNKWVLFELNAWPGLVDCDAGKAEKESMKNLALRLVNCLD